MAKKQKKNKIINLTIHAQLLGNTVQVHTTQPNTRKLNILVHAAITFCACAD